MAAIWYHDNISILPIFYIDDFHTIEDVDICLTYVMISNICGYIFIHMFVAFHTYGIDISDIFYGEWRITKTLYTKLKSNMNIDDYLDIFNDIWGT